MPGFRVQGSGLTVLNVLNDPNDLNHLNVLKEHPAPPLYLLYCCLFFLLILLDNLLIRQLGCLTKVIRFYQSTIRRMNYLTGFHLTIRSQRSKRSQRS